jgi:hypothetical protein
VVRNALALTCCWLATWPALAATYHVSAEHGTVPSGGLPAHPLLFLKNSCDKVVYLPSRCTCSEAEKMRGTPPSKKSAGLPQVLGGKGRRCLGA